MNPVALHVRNYRCFDRLDLDLPVGCVAILGQNGVGKSSIVNAIDLTIFGPESRSLAELYSDTAVGDDELLLEVVLEHAGELYRIRRTFSPRGRGKTTLDFERSFTSGYDSLTCASTKETQELIEATLGLTRETFKASAFLAQGDGAAFTEAKPDARKRILGKVLGLDRYDRLQERARQERRTVEAQLHSLAGRTAAAQEQAAGRKDVELDLEECKAAIVEAADVIADLEREHEQLSVRYQEAREQDARRAAAGAELREATSLVEQLTTRANAADGAARKIVAAVADLEKLPAAGNTAALEAREAELAAAVEEHARATRERDELLHEHDRLTRERDDLRARATQLQGENAKTIAQIDELGLGTVEHCPTCAQTLGDAARATTIDTLTKQSVAMIDEITRLRQQADAVVLPQVPPGLPPAPTVELDTVRAQLRTIRASATTRAQLEERIRQLEPVAASGPGPDDLRAALVEVTAKTAALEQLAPIDLAEITTAGGLVRQRLDSARATLDQQRTLKVRLDERLARIADAEQQLQAHAAERQTLESSVLVAAACERAFSPSGIPTLILENSAIPQIEADAQKILARLGGKTASATVELRTQRELKSGDGVAEALDIVMTTEDGHAREYRCWSGGERMRLDIALRAALARLLATRRGAASGIFVIDEPEGLDAAGKAALVEILRDMQTEGVERVYLISHDSELRDSFDETLTVIADDETTSHVEQAAGPIAVTA